MAVRVIHASGKDARRWLALNRDNRRLSQSRVSVMAEAMLRGEWRLNNDAIAIEGKVSAADARLINGQHRAMALQVADERKPGISVPMLVMDDLPHATEEVIDVGKSRSLEDTLTFLGEVKPRPLAAAITLAWHVKRGTYLSRNPTPTRTQQLEFLRDNPDLREAVVSGQIMSRGARIPASGVTVALWLAGRGHHVERLDRFVSEVSYGEGLTQKDPTYQLRELFASWTLNRSTDRSRPWRVCAITVHAWNRFATGSKTTSPLSRMRITEIPEAL